MSANRDIVAQYFKLGYRVVIWPEKGDIKGPTEKGWTTKVQTLEDYNEGDRVGLMTGVEVSPGKYLTDVDIDWAEGALLAAKMLPPTDFVFGHGSKRISHCFYLLPEALPSYRYEDIDKTCLIEFRGTKVNGEIGNQTMVPPSVWSKEDRREPLEFLKKDLAFPLPAFIELAKKLQQDTCLAAIALLLSRHFGKNGFGHEARLCWAGFLLRAGIPVEDLVRMGEAISGYCANLEVADVRRVVESTHQRLSSSTQKIKGGPSLARLLGDKGKAVVNRINEWLGRDSDFLRDKNGLVIKDSQENIRRAVALLGIDLSYNEFAEKMLFEEASSITPLTDESNDTLWLRIDSEYHFRPTKTFFDTVVRATTYLHKFHPVREYLNGLVWDGVPRIDTWLRVYGGASEGEYFEKVASLVLLAAVRRIRHPGCKYDEMLVLEGPQGMNKSSAIRALCPNDDWFSDDLPLNVDAKQVIERTLGKWIIEASDLAGKRKTEVEQLKAMLSRGTDGPARLAYARFPIERPRQFILIGTTNSNNYLTDSTGGRRFWPIRIQKFDVAGLLRDRDQLWAEASMREAKGESIRLPEHLWAEAAKHQEERREMDSWEEVIGGAILSIQPGATGRVQVSTDTLWGILGIEVARRERSGMLRISEIMQRFGFHRQSIREEGRVVRGYVGEQTLLDFSMLLGVEKKEMS